MSKYYIAKKFDKTDSPDFPWRNTMPIPEPAGGLYRNPGTQWRTGDPWLPTGGSCLRFLE